MDFARVEALNLMSKSDELDLCDKLQVPLQARRHVPIAVQIEIIGNVPAPEQHLWFSELKTPLKNEGQGEVWNFISIKYGHNPTILYYKFRQILQLEVAEIDWEETIDNQFAETEQLLNNFQLEHAQHIFNVLQNVAHKFIEKNNNWKHSQRYEKESEWPICIKIQGWMDTLLARALALRNCLKTSKDSVRYDSPELHQIEALLNEVDRLISKIANNAFLQELNPPRFVKKDQAFPLRYRHWLGRQFFPQEDQVSRARVSVINANQFAGLCANPDHFRTVIGTLSSGLLENFEIDIDQSDLDANGHLILTFEECKVARGRQNINREPRATVNTVRNEKFCLLAEFTISIEADLIVTVWTVSQPIIIGTNLSQELRSLATILWDNAFCEPGRTTVVIPSRMPCPQLLNGLDQLHKDHVGIPLSEINREYLRDRMLGRAGTLPEDEITFEQFCDLPIFAEFTFWEWFMGALKLSKEYFEDMYRDGYIFGFLGRQFVPPYLAPYPHGTLFLHFSESMVGGLVISWKNENDEIMAGGPFDKVLLEQRSLANSIADIAPDGNFRFIYPNHNLGVIFGHYDLPPQAPVIRRGYVRPVLRTAFAHPVNVNPVVNGNGHF